MLKKALLLLIPFKCPCGTYTLGSTAAMRHLETHPDTMGVMDADTGAIIW